MKSSLLNKNKKYNYRNSIDHTKLSHLAILAIAHTKHPKRALKIFPTAMICTPHPILRG